MSIGDVNSQERGSGARYNDSKPDLSLIPLVTLYDEARVWMHGKKKYAAWNWAKGMDWSVPYACAMRHLAAWQRGEDIDEESGLPHLAHAMCNLRMLTLYADVFPEGDDRPTKWLNREPGEELMELLHGKKAEQDLDEGDIQYQLDWGLDSESDVWIENIGVAPVCELVEVNFRNDEYSKVITNPKQMNWDIHTLNDFDITHYRVIK